MKEQWADVEGYEGRYSVSSYGRVKSLSRTSPRETKRFNYPLPIKGRIRKLYVRQRYHVVTLSNKKVITYLVHRLVAQAFIPNPQNKPFINHKDGNPANNHVSNLEWCTHGENMQHAHDTGLIANNPKGEKHYFSRVNEKQVLEIRKLKSQGVRSVDIARKFGLHPATIGDITKRRSWNHI